MLETLEGLIRSPRSILWADGTHEVRYVPPRSSLAAALLNSLFEHPAWGAPVMPNLLTNEIPACPHGFSTAR
jgi:hypothetical protein